jgi:DNA polymerase I-like protein with 3'-5' exonuclease and polymerase domains
MALYCFQGEIRIITIGLPSGKVLYIDLGGWNQDKKKEIVKYKEVLEIYFDKLRDPEVVVVGANLKFDLTYLYEKFGVKATNTRDLMLMSQIYWSGVGLIKATKGTDRSERCLLSHGLKDILIRLGFAQINKEEQTSNWGWNLNNHQINYACKDSAVLIPAFLKFRELIVKENLVYSASAECGVLPVFTQMEIMGMPVNVKKAKEILINYEVVLEDKVQVFEDSYPDISWTSNPQLLETLGPKYSISSVGTEVLMSFRDKDPAIDALLDARTLLNTINYLKNVIDRSFPNKFGVHSVRTHFRQIVPSGTGRSSCKGSVSKKAPDTGVQLQNPANTPKKFKHLGELRSVFEAPSGWKLIIADLSQCHQRIACELAKDPVLTSIYKEDRDAHIVMAIMLAEMDNWEIEEKDFEAIYNDKKHPLFSKTKFYRTVAKTANYSGLNIGGVVRIKLALKEHGINATDADAKKLQTAWRELYKVLYRNILDEIKKANKVNADFSYLLDRNGNPLNGVYGEIRGLTGRRQYGMKTPNRFDETKLEVPLTDMTSFRWLSAEADMIKSAQAKLYLEFLAHPEWQAYFANFAHDELNIMCREEYAEDVAQIVGITLKSELSNFIKTIPVEEPNLSYSSFIAQSWNEK